MTAKQFVVSHKINRTERTCGQKAAGMGSNPISYNMRRLLCLIGIHKWSEEKTFMINNHENMTSRVHHSKTCLCCDKYVEYWT